MWNSSGRPRELCVEYREALEELHAELGQAEGKAQLQSSLRPEVLAHAQSCESCQEADEIFWESRGFLAGERAAAVARPGASAEHMPWFATRVMAKIAEREAEVLTASTDWSTAVTRLASRLAWISAIALAATVTLVYEPQPAHEAKTVVSQTPAEAPQYLFETATTPSSVDDALAGTVER